MWQSTSERDRSRQIEITVANLVATNPGSEVTESYFPTVSARQQGIVSSLRVLREPHTVRPPSDIGVVYRKPLFRSPQLSLKNPPRLPAYACNAIERETGHRLCQACLDAFNYYAEYLKAYRATRGDASNIAMSNAVVHHHYLYTLRELAKIEQCYICQRLIEKIEYLWPEALQKKNLTRFQVEMWWGQATDPKEKSKILFVLTDPTKNRIDMWNTSKFYGLDIWPTQTCSQYVEALSGNDKSTTREGQDKTSCTESRDLVVSWLSRCRSNEGNAHLECNMLDDHYLPARLLDVELARSESRLRLVCLESNPAFDPGSDDFITLSHCWGEWGAKNNPVLKSNNLAEAADRTTRG